MSNKGTNDIWRQNLASFLYDLLIKAEIIETHEKNVFFDDKNLKIWADAFTHETYSTTDNYEDLEYVGDAILKAVFPTYLRKLFPKLNRAKYTEINISYMSKMQQGLLSRKLGLGQYIRVANEISANLNLESDVFESFFGALFEVSNNVDNGSGYTCCFNMIIYLFNDITINEESHKGANKSIVLQIFSRFKLENLQEIELLQNEQSEKYTLEETTLFEEDSFEQSNELFELENFLETKKYDLDMLAFYIKVLEFK